MSLPRKIDLLPIDVREELDRKLITNGFSDHKGLSEWLQSQGFEISKAIVGSHSLKLKQRIQSIKRLQDYALAFKHNIAEDDEAIARMSTKVAQSAVFELCLKIQEKIEFLTQNDIDDGELEKLIKWTSAITKSIADVNKMDLAIKKYQDTVKISQERRSDELVAEAKSRGINEEFILYVRNELLKLL